PIEAPQLVIEPGKAGYQRGRIRFNFQTRATVDADRPFSSETHDYEESIISFMVGTSEREEAQLPNAGRVMIIRGATGAGKTTTLEYCSSRAIDRTKQLGNERELWLVPLQFNDVDGVMLETSGAIDLSYFWRYVASKVIDVFNVDVETAVEVGVFLKWCSRQPELKAHVEPLFRFLETALPKVHAFVDRRGLGTITVDQLLDHLLREREHFIGTMTEKELAIYGLAKFRFTMEQEDAKHRRIVLIVDNVDHLPPAFQTELVRFSMWVAQFLTFKLVIAIRPLTWENLHGQHVLHVEVHQSTSLADVLSSRLRTFAHSKSVDEDTKAAVQALISELANSHYHLRTVIYGTSGISVRAAIRNFANFISSPLLDRHSLHDIANRTLQVSELIRAYLFSTDSTIDQTYFENLFSVGQRRTPHLALLKCRALDFILRAQLGRTPLIELVEFLRSFGHSEDNILVAVNELMYRNRALLWSNEAFRFDTLDERLKRATASVAPAGCSYYANLFGEYFYTEACLANSRIKTVPAQSVVAFSRDLIDQDDRAVTLAASSTRQKDRSPRTRSGPHKGAHSLSLRINDFLPRATHVGTTKTRAHVCEPERAIKQFRGKRVRRSPRANRTSTACAPWVG
ncbi:MAG TPA: hypothetical protein DHW63_06395, partial [Hyphomonadaceae bacterium]|nr:hypothetical protein [Hyphomonadaceae bacterium]